MGGWVYLDYSVSSGPFLRFSKRFEFLSETFDHSVCENRDLSLTILVLVLLSVQFSYRVNFLNTCSTTKVM